MISLPEKWFSRSVTEVCRPLSYHVTLSNGRAFQCYVEHINVQISQSSASDTSFESDIEISTVYTTCFTASCTTFQLRGYSSTAL